MSEFYQMYACHIYIMVLLSVPSQTIDMRLRSELKSSRANIS